MMKNEEKLLLMNEIQKRISQQKIKEKNFIEKYGHVRKIVHCNTEDFKCIAVGETLLWDKQWNTFIDFLMDYPKNILGKEWWELNINCNKREEHPIISWHKLTVEFQQRQTKNSKGLYYSKPNESMLSYLLFAYDLYTIEHNYKLQKIIINRLKNIKGFQGALYELFVTSVFIRADFIINYTDESDHSMKHPEFVAENTNTGQQIAVEAKSRHRSGLLGIPGETPKKVKLDITKKINEALKKDPKQPFIIFIDLNLPKYKKNQQSNFKQLISEYKKSYEMNPINDEFNIIFFTDHHPYSITDFSVAKDFNNPLIIISKNPSYKIQGNNLVLSRIRKSISQFGNIPNGFSEMDFDNIIEIKEDL